MIKNWKEYNEANRLWNEQRKEIAAENERLIKYWRSIPWWKFWAHVPFEEQRQIILDNWNKLPPPPMFPLSPGLSFVDVNPSG